MYCICGIELAGLKGVVSWSWLALPEATKATCVEVESVFFIGWVVFTPSFLYVPNKLRKNSKCA